MVWLVEKKVFYHLLDVGFESVNIPVRVKFEFEIEEGSFVPDSMSVETLYNRQALEKRYPNLKSELLDSAIDETVRNKIQKYLVESGFASEANPPE